MPTVIVKIIYRTNIWKMKCYVIRIILKINCFIFGKLKLSSLYYIHREKIFGMLTLTTYFKVVEIGDIFPILYYYRKMLSSLNFLFYIWSVLFVKSLTEITRIPHLFLNLLF